MNVLFFCILDLVVVVVVAGVGVGGVAELQRQRTVHQECSTRGTTGTIAVLSLLSSSSCFVPIGMGSISRCWESSVFHVELHPICQDRDPALLYLSRIPLAKQTCVCAQWLFAMEYGLDQGDARSECRSTNTLIDRLLSVFRDYRGL